jgi:hypothetical protein
VLLQNRVNPCGELCAFSPRGQFMGNRGGRFHTDAKTLTARRWVSRQWICCVLNFKGRRREVGAVPTPSCSFLTSQPRSPPGTGPARVIRADMSLRARNRRRAQRSRCSRGCRGETVYRRATRGMMGRRQGPRTLERTGRFGPRSARANRAAGEGVRPLVKVPVSVRSARSLKLGSVVSSE